MKIWVAVGTIGLVLLGVIGCTFEGSKGDQINGLTPAEAVLKYEKALLQEDGTTVKELATKEQADVVSVIIDLSKGPQNKENLPTTFPFKEYTVDDDRYYYVIHATSKRYYEVTRTEHGWKIDQIPMYEFEKIIEGLEPNNLQGVYQGDEI